MWLPFAAAVLSATASAPCDIGALTLHTDFPGASSVSCLRTEEGFALDIVPETWPLNNSPWYAFTIESDARRDVQVTLRYPQGRHRYIPKRRGAGGWEPLPSQAVSVSEDRSLATLRFSVNAGTTEIAAQQVLPPAERLTYWKGYEAHGDARVTVAGHSAEGRAIVQLDIGASAGAPTIVILGGQHPPEVPGSLALRAFTERLMDDDAPAKGFREKFRILMFPVLNPDGIAHGHWRTNGLLTDLNRDWGPFAEPETRLVQKALSEVDPMLLLDFHATWRGDLLYTTPGAISIASARFPSTWARSIDARLGGEGFRQVEIHRPGATTAKTWFVDTYRRPAITVELGDETPTARISELGATAAEAFMTILMAENREGRTEP